MKKHIPVIIVGGGQAGLSISYCLKEKNIEHIIFEKDRIAESWRSQRWDTFCLVTPNWQCKLPGFEYDGDEPRGFMEKEDIVSFIERYARSFDPPIYEGVEVTGVRKKTGDEVFGVDTSQGDYIADQVVIAAGNFQFGNIPDMAQNLDEELLQLHSSEYRNPECLPEGDVLVVGSGQSGAQIAEDLMLAGKNVHLCVGSAPRSPRRYRGKDVVKWLDEMGYYDQPIYEHPDGLDARNKTNHYLTGRDGGHEIDLRQFALDGMQLYGRLTAIKDGDLHFQGNLRENLKKADASARGIKQKIDSYISEEGIKAPKEPPYEPVWEPEEEVSSLNYRDAGIGTVIWAIGYDFDYSWIDLPVFDDSGYPVYHRGVTPVERLYFLGMAWMYTWGSGRFAGIARDAEYLADQIEKQLRVATEKQ